MTGNWRKKTLFCPDHFPDFNLESSIIIKNMFIMKQLTDFCKMVKISVDLHLEVMLTQP